MHQQIDEIRRKLKIFAKYPISDEVGDAVESLIHSVGRVLNINELFKAEIISAIISDVISDSISFYLREQNDWDEYNKFDEELHLLSFGSPKWDQETYRHYHEGDIVYEND